MMLITLVIVSWWRTQTCTFRILQWRRCHVTTQPDKCMRYAFKHVFFLPAHLFACRNHEDIEYQVILVAPSVKTNWWWRRYCSRGQQRLNDIISTVHWFFHQDTQYLLQCISSGMTYMRAWHLHSRVSWGSFMIANKCSILWNQGKPYSMYFSNSRSPWLLFSSASRFFSQSCCSSSYSSSQCCSGSSGASSGAGGLECVRPDSMEVWSP